MELKAQWAMMELKASKVSLEHKAQLAHKA
jgi:hypothetical protein